MRQGGQKINVFVGSALVLSAVSVALATPVAHAAPFAGRTSVAVGYSHTMIVRPDGTVWTFGRNNWGQLGQSGADRNYGTDVANPTPARVPGLGSVIAVEAGADTSVALKADGTVWTWGQNRNGELGRTTANLGVDGGNPTPGKVLGLDHIRALAQGSLFGAALRIDGTVLTWGNNKYGQLGNDTNTKNDTPNPTATKVEGLFGIVAIAAGSSHLLALDSSGVVWSFGNNGQGQLGYTTPVTYPNPVPQAIPGISGAVAIAAGGANSYIVTANGQVLAFGRNQYGQLGTTNGNGSVTASPTPTAIPGVSDAVAVSAATEDVIIRRHDGTLLSLGRNLYGNLGTTVGLGDPNAANYVPTPIPGLANIVDVQAGLQHTVTVGFDGTVKTFGLNLYGELGRGANLATANANQNPVAVGIISDLPVHTFVSVVPQRLFETRIGPDMKTVDGDEQGTGPLAADSIFHLPVAGRGGLAADAAAVALNVTVTNAAAAGYLTVWPCAPSRPPGTSNVNFDAGSTVANEVISRLGDGGEVCIYSSVTTDVIVDSSGYFVPSSPFVSITPHRLLETRVGPDYKTTDGHFQGLGPRVAGEVTHVKVQGRGGVDASAKAVVLNVTATNVSADGYVTVYPCGGTPPGASNINPARGVTTARLVMTSVGPGGEVCIYTSVALDLIADVSGYFPGSTVSYVPLAPRRFLETRAGHPRPADQAKNVTTQPADTTYRLRVRGRFGVPDTATGVVLSVTIPNSPGNGFVTVWPCGPRPRASNVNTIAGGTVSNLVLSQISADGYVCLYTLTRNDLVVDVAGYFTG